MWISPGHTESNNEGPLACETYQSAALLFF